MATKKVIFADDLLLSVRDDPEIDGQHFARFKEHIEHAPTPDAVEVVCCKDCRQWHKSPTKGFCYCMHTMMGRVTKPDDFCSYGERREGDA